MKRNGFTLIELLAVILILGIIAVIAIPSVSKIIKDSRRGSYIATGSNMMKAAEGYYQNCRAIGICETKGLTIIEDNIIFLSSITTEEELRTEIELKGKLIPLEDIKYFGIDTTGRAEIKYKVDSYFCETTKPGEKIECNTEGYKEESTE